MDRPGIDRLARSLSEAATALWKAGERAIAREAANVVVRSCGPKQRDLVKRMARLIGGEL